MRLRSLTNRDLERAGIPEDCWRVSLERIPDAAPQKESLAAYLKGLDGFVSDGVGLYCWSNTNGTGKTGAISLMGIQALRTGKTVYFTTAEDLRVMVPKDTMFDESMTVLQRARTVDLLLLDELGKEYQAQSGFAESVIESLLRYRVQRRKATLISTNLDPNSVKDRYSVDLKEAMKQGFITLRFADKDNGGRDWRGERATEIKQRLNALR
jgi:hypothetical protein